ncbi:hypothetical protein ACWCP6_26745 [Streptomyces sp. NPDC002004]
MLVRPLRPGTATLYPLATTIPRTAPGSPGDITDGPRRYAVRARPELRRGAGTL